jgi:hypothetical protein
LFQFHTAFPRESWTMRPACDDASFASCASGVERESLLGSAEEVASLCDVDMLASCTSATPE